MQDSSDSDQDKSSYLTSSMRGRVLTSQSSQPDDYSQLYILQYN